MRDKTTQVLEDQQRRDAEKRRSLLCRMAGNIAAGLVVGERQWANLTSDYSQTRTAEAAVSIAQKILEAVDAGA